jgi:hypothetical protein
MGGFQGHNTYSARYSCTRSKFRESNLYGTEEPALHAWCFFASVARLATTLCANMTETPTPRKEPRPSFLGFLPVSRLIGGLHLRLAPHHAQHAKPKERQCRSNLRNNDVVIRPAPLLDRGSCHRGRCEFRQFESSSLPKCSDGHSVESITKPGAHLPVV